MSVAARISEAEKPRYPTKAKVQFAVAMAREAGIAEVGSIEIAPDGSIKITAKAESVADDYEQWKVGRGRK